MNSMLLTDGYKLDHRRQYPKGTECVYSTWIPRNMEYLSEKLNVKVDKAVSFGFQFFVKKYLVENFNKYFFSRPKEEVLNEYQTFIDDFMPGNTIGVSHIEELYDLGYLPIEIKALKEGTLCPKGVPMLTIKNTLPQFFWVTNYLETLMSSGLWLATNSATIAYHFKKNLYEHFRDTVGLEYTKYFSDFLVHDFSMRGMGGVDAAINSGLGHIACFYGSETIPAIQVAKEYYNAEANVCSTVPASEHSVMCAGSKENEEETFRRLFNEIYPEGFVSIVSDTWDYWRVITEYLPKFKEEIMARNGRVVIRPDSGDPVHIICGYRYLNLTNKTIEEIKDSYLTEFYKNKFYLNGMVDWDLNFEIKKDKDQKINTFVSFYFKAKDNKFYKTEKLEDDKFSVEEVHEAEVIGTYEYMWKIFGGTKEKGYKVLDTHIGLIYGDSITLPRQKEIYDRLKEKGFAATNLVLGVGSYTYQNNTRDQLGFAMKATWVKINGQGQEIFKEPKTDNGLKKSLVGLCKVVEDGDTIKVVDKVSEEEENTGLLQTIFKDGKVYNEQSMTEIRETINKFI